MPYCRNTSADEKNSSGKANASASGGAEKNSSNANTSAHKVEKNASSEEKASSEEDSSDGESGAEVCKDCEWAGKGELCGKQQDDGSHCWSYCCNRTLLHKILDFGSTEGLFERAPMKRCALIGAADSLSGQGKGAEIDEHDTVIRINRLPTSQFFHDVGEKRTVYFASDKVMRLWGAIPMMGSSEENDNGLAWQCNEMNQCMHAALIFNSDGEEPCPLEELQEAFGDGHPLISCVNPMVKELTWRFKAVLEKPATTGFMTFVTMAALCEELDVYGFQGSGTTDGHVEWADHPLEAEHAIEHFIAEGDWDSCDLQYDWKGWVNEGMKKFWPWYQDNVAKIEFRG